MKTKEKKEVIMKRVLVIAVSAIDRNCDVLPIVEYSIETDDGQTLN